MKTCTVPGCDRPAKQQRRMCHAHISRKNRGQPLDAPIRRWRPKDSPSRPPCSVLGCYRPEKGNTGICAGHVRRRDIMRLEDWARPLKVYRRRGTTRDVTARVSVEVADALTRRAKVEGVDRAELIRHILETHVRNALVREVA